MLIDYGDEKFQEEFLKIAYPAWLRGSKLAHDFRGFIIDKHAILEHLFDLLIIVHFLGTSEHSQAEEFRTVVLSRIDYSKKVSLLQELSLLSKKEAGLMFRVNDYRLAQAHIKKGNPLREPSTKNFEDFQSCSTKAHSLMASKIMMKDSEINKKVLRVIST